MKTEITTDKIILKAPEKSDAENLYSLRSNPVVNRFIKRNIPKCIADAEKFIEQRSLDTNGFYFIIRTQPDSEFAGAICLWNIDKESKYAEVGYELLPDFQGRGIMTNALREIINLAFTKLHIETLKAITHTDNLPSRKLLETFHFKLIPGKADPDNANNIIYFRRC